MTSCPLSKVSWKLQFFFKPAAVAERLCSEREIPRSNPGILPLLNSAYRECDGPPCHIPIIQCTPLLGEKAVVAPGVTFGIAAHKQERVQVRDPLRIWNQWGRTHKVQNRSNQQLHKLGLGPKKKKITILVLWYFKYWLIIQTRCFVLIWYWHKKAFLK